MVIFYYFFHLNQDLMSKSWCESCFPCCFNVLAWEIFTDKKNMWRSGKVQACHIDDVGLHTGGVICETFNLCRRSKSLSKQFNIYMPSGMPESLPNTRLNWSCVTRCGCRTTLSDFFTVRHLYFQTCFRTLCWNETINGFPYNWNISILMHL